MIPVLTLILSTVFGGGDQYLGSLGAHHPWTIAASGLSAPWLLLPFVAGAVQRTPRRAIIIGAASTVVALAGYCAMTLSPVENAHPTIVGLVGFFHGGNDRWLLGGLVAGPIFGWLGHRFRSERVALCGLAVAFALCLEPIARRAYGPAVPSFDVAAGEVSMGIAAAVTVITTSRRHRRHV